MAGKKLLEESTIRRFMQLANIKPLNEGSAGGHSAEEAGQRIPNLRTEKKHHVEEELEETKHVEKEGKKHVEEKKKHHGGKVEEKKKHHGGKVEEKKSHLEEDALEEAHHMEEDLEESLEELGHRRYEEGLEEEEELGGMEAGEPEGTEGGETGAAEDLASSIAELLNSYLESVGSTKKVAQEPEGEEPEGEEPADMGGEEEEEEGQMEEGLFEGLIVEDDEALAEELTRRVAARLVREMKAHKSGHLNHGSYHVKGHSMVKKGQTGEKAATGGGTKHAKAPKAGGKPSTGHLKPAVPSKSANNGRNGGKGMGGSGTLTTHGKKK